jgi:hypothetical protein
MAASRCRYWLARDKCWAIALIGYHSAELLLYTRQSLQLIELPLIGLSLMQPEVEYGIPPSRLSDTPFGQIKVIFR